MRYLLIKNEIVVNVIMYDGVSEYDHTGFDLVEDIDAEYNIGDLYNG